MARPTRYFDSPNARQVQSSGLPPFKTLDFQDLIRAEESNSPGHAGPVRLEHLVMPQGLVITPISPLVPNLTPERNRRRTMTPAEAIKWKGVPQSPGEEVSQDGSNRGQDDDNEEYDGDTSSASEGIKENASPTHSADFAKRLSLKTPKRRSRGERNEQAEVKYGRLQNPDKIKVLKARIKEMNEKHDVHKEKVKRGRPSAKDLKDKADGKVNLDTPKRPPPEKTYACDVCDKTFGTKGTLKQHAKVHLNPEMLLCVLCDKSFKTAETLATHQRLHQPDNPYRCATCSKAFTNQGALDRHAQTHETQQTPKGLKPYACPTCHLTYANKFTLSRHISKAKHAVETEETSKPEEDLVEMDA